MVHTEKVFSIVSEADRNVFWDSLVFSMIQWMLAILYLVPQTSFYIWKFSVHVVLRLNLKDFEHYLASKWDEHNCMICLTFFGIAFLLDWNENWSFSALWLLLCFPNFADILNASLLQPHYLGFLNSSAGIPSPLLSLLVVMLPKAHLTSYSSISGFTWVTQTSPLSQSLWLFLYSSSVHSWHLFLISSAFVRSLTFLFFIVPNLARMFLW